MKKIIRIFSLITALCLVLTLGGCGNKKEEKKPEGTAFEKGTLCNKESQLSFENDKLILSIDYDTCNITVTEKASGRVWSSNPNEDYSDSIAAGVTKTNLFSQLVVNYVGNTNALIKTNSYAASVRKGTYQIYKIENGFRVDYEFDKGFKIPVSYTIAGDKLTAAILYTGITEGENEISTIELLPYFGTADSSAKGFMLIPDGSGAIINFNNGKTNCTEYSKKVYGVDESLPNDIVTTREEQIYIPLIGMNKNGGAFIAKAKSGAAESYVNASVAGISSDFNTVYFKAIYRAAENLSVMNGSLGTAGLVLYSAEEPSDAEEFSVEYSFIEGKNPDLGDMAARARAELIDEGEIVKTKDENKLCVDLYGGVSKPKSFLGIQYNGVETLTKFKQAKKIIEKICNVGCNNLSLGYKNYSKSYFGNNSQVDLTPDSALGGKKEMKKLISFAKTRKTDLYFFADYYSFSSTGKGYSKYFDVTKELDLGAAQIYPKKLNTNIPDNSADPYYILKPAKFSDAANKIIKSADKLSVDGIYLGDISSKISGDYEIGQYKRSGAVKKAEESVKILSKKSLLLSSPNLYMWKYADRAVDLPVFSSSYHLFDYDVPFLQMLLKGSIPYAGYELNLYNTDDDTLLRHYAFAQGLHYGFMADDASDLQNTALVNCYGLSDAKIDASVQNGKEFDKFYSYIKDLYIDNYTVSGDVSKTVYSDGTFVLVNYGDDDTECDGIAVKARSYTVVSADNAVLTGGDTE